MSPTPEIVLAPEQAHALASLHAEMVDLERIEADLLRAGNVSARLRTLCGPLREQALSAWTAHDHFLLRGVPATEDGATALLLAGALFRRLRSYRGGQIVKRFRMTPWTTALSHTLAEGTFHTDLNTATEPPAATLTQCLHPDPDAPRHGQLRVARMRDVVDTVRTAGHASALHLLTEDHVVMANDASADHWSGKIDDGAQVRFHPETLRAGQRRLGRNPPDLEDSLRAIHEAAMSVSSPIDLAAGDVLVVSNRRALHQRGACTVRFRTFPSDFETRAVAVMHTMDDLA